MAPEKKDEVVDRSLSNPDTLTKYRTAGEISQKVLAEVSKLCVAGAKIVDICKKGDEIMKEELAKVYRGKSVKKGQSHPTTISPNAHVTPYDPLPSDEKEAATELQAGELVKIQLGAQIDEFPTIVCDTIICPTKDQTDNVVTGRSADLLLATHYANELLLRLMIPSGLLASGTDEEKAKAAAAKAPTQSKMTSLLEKVVQTYGCNLVQGTTSWLFKHKLIEGEKKIIIAPGDGAKGDGVPEVGEVWGVEVGVSLGSGKIKELEQRTTLHRRTETTYILKSARSRKILSDLEKQFSHFPFTLRQLENEREAKAAIHDCVRHDVVREYQVVADKDNEPVARYLTTFAITKNGITKLGGPPTLDLSKVQSDKQITDEEILKILEQPLARNTGKSKNKKKNKKKKPANKEDGKADAAGENDDDSDEE